MVLKEKKPRITIGLTAYNSAKSIENAIQSARSQKWSDLEIIIVDDASTDNTLLIIRNTIKSYPQEKLIQNASNKGVAVCRNLIIQESSGEFIVFFDDDDISKPERIAKQYKRIIDYESGFSEEIFLICHTARLQLFPDGRKQYIPTITAVPLTL